MVAYSEIEAEASEGGRWAALFFYTHFFMEFLFKGIIRLGLNVNNRT